MFSNAVSAGRQQPKRCSCCRGYFALRWVGGGSGSRRRRRKKYYMAMIKVTPRVFFEREKLTA
jgi:hypothetical protein